jgi:hypothetical protein
MPNHHFYSGDWDNPSRIGATGPSQAEQDYGALNGSPVGTPIQPARYSVVVDLNADTYGHIQHAYTQEMQKLFTGRGLWFNNGTLPNAVNWYHPAKERIVEHPLRLTRNLFNPHYPALEGYTTNQASPYGGEVLWENTGGSYTQPVDGIDYVFPYLPGSFFTNDSGHLQGINWVRIPPVRGPKGDKGDAAIVAAYVASTGTLPAGSLATASVVNVGTSSNANFAFTFNIPRGQDGTNGAQGPQGPAGSGATVAALAQLVGTGGPSVSVVNLGTTQNAVFRFDFQIPTGGGPITGDVNNYYNTSVENIGNYGLWRSLVYNPGNNNPIFIKRVAADGALDTFEVADTVIFYHRSRNWSPDGIVSFDLGGLGWNDGRIYTEPDYDGSFITFPRHIFNSSGHLISVVPGEPIPIGGGGGGSNYTWRVGTQLTKFFLKRNSVIA